MEFKVSVCAQQDQKEYHHLVGYMNAPEVLQMFHRVDWQTEYQRLKQKNISSPVLLIEDLDLGHELRISLSDAANHFQFDCECQFKQHKRHFFGMLHSTITQLFSAARLSLEDLGLAVALFLAGDHQQLARLYSFLKKDNYQPRILTAM